MAARSRLQRLTDASDHIPFTGEEGVRRATARHAASLAELPEAARRLSEGEPVIPTEFI